MWGSNRTPPLGPSEQRASCSRWLPEVRCRGPGSKPIAGDAVFEGPATGAEGPSWGARACLPWEGLPRNAVQCVRAAGGLRANSAISHLCCLCDPVSPSVQRERNHTGLRESQEPRGGCPYAAVPALCHLSLP